MNFDMKLYLDILQKIFDRHNEHKNLLAMRDEQLLLHADLRDTSEVGVMKYAKKLLEETVLFMQQFLTKNKIYIHPQKQTLLEKTIERFSDLLRRTDYYANHGKPDFALLYQILMEAEEYLSKYFWIGPVYLFRHCDKAKRINHHTGEEYDGIPKKAIVDQAMARADAITDEIRLCPYYMHVFVRHTEMPRTRAFANIIMHRISHINHLSEGKVKFDGPKKDNHIRFGLFSKEALGELMPIYKEKGDFYCYYNWFLHTNEFASLQHQPAVNEVVNSVVKFLNEFQHKVTKGGEKTYRMAIGVSHAWVIDSLIQTLIPSWHDHAQQVMDTASFVKVEAGEFNYLGKWVPFNK